MPRYDFRCHDCTTIFEEERAMARASAPATCPQCGGEHTYKLLSQVTVTSGSRPVESTPAQTSGCGCGGGCACGTH